VIGESCIASADIQSENIISYSRDVKKLRERLERTIAVVVGKAESLESR
jgi:hypothetical protein